MPRNRELRLDEQTVTTSLQTIPSIEFMSTLVVRGRKISLYPGGVTAIADIGIDGDGNIIVVDRDTEMIHTRQESNGVWDAGFNGPPGESDIFGIAGGVSGEYFAGGANTGKVWRRLAGVWSELYDLPNLPPSSGDPDGLDTDPTGNLITITRLGTTAQVRTLFISNARQPTGPRAGKMDRNAVGEPVTDDGGHEVVTQTAAVVITNP